MQILILLLKIKNYQWVEKRFCCLAYTSKNLISTGKYFSCLTSPAVVKRRSQKSHPVSHSHLQLISIKRKFKLRRQQRSPEQVKKLVHGTQPIGCCGAEPARRGRRGGCSSAARLLLLWLHAARLHGGKLTSRECWWHPPGVTHMGPHCYCSSTDPAFTCWCLISDFTPNYSSPNTLFKEKLSTKWRINW